MHPESARDRRIRLSDARALGYTEWGDPDGAPVLGFHGTGLSRLAHLGDAAPRTAKVHAGLGAWSSAPELDRALLANPTIRSRLAASLHETARRGSGGPARDLTLLYTKPWGFRPGLDVRAPVYLWHGDLDATVPVGVARLVARALPRCSARIEPGRGHLLLWAVAGEVLDALAGVR